MRAYQVLLLLAILVPTFVLLQFNTLPEVGTRRTARKAGGSDARSAGRGGAQIANCRGPWGSPAQGRPAERAAGATQGAEAVGGATPGAEAVVGA